MQRLVGRRRPFGTPLPTRPYVISVPFTQTLDPFPTKLTRWCLSECSFTKIFRIVLDDGRCFLMTAVKRIENSFKKRSLALNTHWELHFGENRVHRLPSNHCHPTETDSGFEFSNSQNPPLESHFGEIQWIGCLATILIRGERTPDSISPPLKTLWDTLSGEIRVYRLPSNHSYSTQTDPGFEFTTSNYSWMYQNPSQLVSCPKMFFWPGYRQTDRQTNLFNFVRPSFQSREQ